MKKDSKEKPLITLTEINIGNSVESFTKFLESQKDLFHSQVDQLQRIVVTQCSLTGVNPLSQEMAAGALSINIGKRPRDLLNPKGVKYMQSVFSIKDTITKKETREISALCGLTATQVREFFAGQRSRVRKLVRLSREKAIKAEEAKMSQEGCPTSSDPAMHVIDPTPLNSVDPGSIKSDAERTLQGGCSTNSDPAMLVINPTPLNSLDPKAVGDSSSCLAKEETVPGADDFEKNFIENIFDMMRKEEKFSGQVKLMEWILQIQNSSVLFWFVTKGGLMILAAWLNEAALEEQTTALLVIFQVLCHLPLHKALPLQMSAILQSVNRLRFYRTSDISNRAKVLLSRWSKLFIRSQALKKPSSTFATRKANIFGQSDALNSNWQSNLDLPEEILSLALDSSENCRTSELSSTLKLLQASNDDSNKKNIRNVSSPQAKERRKVQLMEQPDRNTNGRGLQVVRAMHSNQARPMSADDIQKAKLRATFMQSKYRKTGAVSNEGQQLRIVGLNNSSISQTSQLPSPVKSPVKHIIEESEKHVVIHPSETSLTQLEPQMDSKLCLGPVRHIVEESEKSLAHFSETSPAPPEPPMDSKPCLSPEESPWETLKRDQIPWHLPPEIRMNSEWGVAVGDNSKEVDIQTGRIRREKETIYQRIQDIPSNPKEPWDLEMDYDDTLTLQVPTEQAPEEFLPAEQPPVAFSTEELPVAFPTEQPPVACLTEAPLLPCNTSVIPDATTAAAPITSVESGSEPDFELLAVLLKNPELVFALTSGQGGNISSADTVKFLDMIKNSGGSLTGGLNGLRGNINNDEPVSFPSPTPHSFPSPTPTSLPSPTPSSERVMIGWGPEVNNPFPQSVSVADREAYVYPSATPVVPSSIGVSATGLLQHHSWTTNFTPGAEQYQNQEHWVNNMDNVPSELHHHSFSTGSYSERQHPQMNDSSNLASSSPFNSLMAAAHSKLRSEPMSYEQQPETMNYGHMQTVRPSPVSIVLNLPDGTPITLPPLMPPNQQSPHLPEDSFFQQMHPQTVQWNAASCSRHNGMSDIRGGRQRRYDYNSFHEEPMYPDHQSWGRNEFMEEQNFEIYSPGRSRSPEYRSARNYSSERRRDYGRNPRPDWSRRRDSSRHDHKQGNRRWRDRRY